MRKQLFPILFSVILLAVVALPTIDNILLDSLDIEIEISIDEEEKNEKESKTLEFNVFVDQDTSDSDYVYSSSKTDNFYQKNYSDLHQENFCPPPEHI
jgi:hypothetical protein